MSSFEKIIIVIVMIFVMALISIAGYNTYKSWKVQDEVMKTYMNIDKEKDKRAEEIIENFDRRIKK